MKNIHLIQTDEANRGLVFLNNKYLIEDGLCNYPKAIYPSVKGFHVYITSDEEIKDRDWFIDLRDINTEDGLYDEDIYRAGSGGSAEFANKIGKKIILTTDTLDGVQAIDNEFLEWLCANPSCEEVDVTMEYKDGYNNWLVYDKEYWDKHNSTRKKSQKDYPKFGIRYKIIIPEEEPKQNFKNRQIGAAELVSNKIIESMISEFKQKTLEEAADKYSKEHMEAKSFYDGAKWQQKQNNNEALEFGRWIIQNPDFQNDSSWSLETAKFNFKQFKKVNNEN